jgi:hypothetical protein
VESRIREIRTYGSGGKEVGNCLLTLIDLSGAVLTAGCRGPPLYFLDGRARGRIDAYGYDAFFFFTDQN